MIPRRYIPRGAVLQLMRCADKRVMVDGPARTGKTRGLLEKAYLVAANYPGARILLTRKTRTSMSNTVLQTFEDEVLGQGHPLASGASRPLRTAYRFPNGSVIDVLGLDKPERLMSSEYDMIFAFEGTELTQNDFELLTTRLTGYHTGYQQIVVDCNPSSEKHWLWVLHRDGKIKRLPSKLTDNPLWHDGTDWTPAGRELLESLGSLSGVRRARLFEGRWASVDGAVYDRFDEAVHVVDRFTPPSDWMRIRSIDFGYTNPFVCQWWAIDGDGRMYLYREVYQPGRLVSDMAKEITRLSEGEYIAFTVADHDAEDRATLEAAGIHSTPADKAVTPGIQAVQDRLAVQGDGKPRLYIMRDTLASDASAMRDAGKPCCTLQEMDGYVWEQSRDGRPVKEHPVKVNDHGMDAMRYAVMFMDKRGAVTDNAVFGPTIQASEGIYTPIVGGGVW